MTEALGSDSKGGQLASSGPIIGTAKGPVPTEAGRGAILGWSTWQERVTDMHMMQTPRRAADTDLQKVVVVNGSPEILEMLETVLDAGRYDMVFVESSARAYSRVRHVQPNLVIVCMRIDDVEVFQLLSMLKLDAETRRIPVVTYTTHLEADNDESEDDVIEEDEFPLARPTVTMN